MSFRRRRSERVACPVCGDDDAIAVCPDHERDLYQCRQCRLVHANISADAWQAKEYYQHYYSGRSPEFDAITESRYEAILGECERIHRRGRLLDVGCGAGHLLVSAIARGWSAVGQEVSASGLTWLEALKARTGRQFDLVGEDLLDAGLAPASFAAITLIEVLEHLPRPAATLSRCYTLLEPGGVLYLTTPNFDSLTRRLIDVAWRGLSPDHLCVFNVRSLRVALAQAGFQLRRVITKNVDLPEILMKLRRGHSAMELDTVPTSLDVRRRVESSRWLRGAKLGINAGLRMTRTGDTVEALAIRPH